MLKSWIKRLFLVSPLLATVCAASPPDIGAESRGHHCPRWTVDDLIASPTPYALGHRGYGANLGEDPNRPIENTLPAFRRAFNDGIRVVELDLQETADGKIVVVHDDVLADSTCISVVTYDELHAQRPEIPLFRTVLNSLRHFSRSRELSGIIFAEIKVPVPFCDDANTSQQSAISEGRLVREVVADIRRAHMEDQVILNSGSPTILGHVATQAPEIARALTLNLLQLLPPAVVAQITHLPVVQIPKNDFGLAWYNVGHIARLPALPSFPAFVGLSLAVGSRAVSIDKLVLLQAGANAPNVVAAVHGAGLEVIAWTIENAQEWGFIAQAGVDGITTNDIALGLSSQAPLSLLAACNGDDGEDDDHDGCRHGDHDRGHGREIMPGTVAMGIEPDRAYPNPFTSRMQFAYSVAAGTERVEIGVYDLAGRLVRELASGSEAVGRHELSWDGTDATGGRVQPGVFFLRGTVGQRPVGVRLLHVR